MDRNALHSIIEKHRLWRFGEGGARADLRDAYLADANLAGADLTRAYLTNTNLTSAFLSATKLHGAALVDAILSGADLTCANLTAANLTNANFAHADLSHANLTGAILMHTNLTAANLTGANLAGANFMNAIGNMREVKSAQFDRWGVVWTTAPSGAVTIQIGCQRHPFEMWKHADPNWITDMDPNATKWWAKYGRIVLDLVEASPATPWGKGWTFEHHLKKG